ncbi:hypothetical protein [Streptomyces atratus]|uniref:hypothetical protein n=1 Tax=Streptomyces atratus TaxID=1893 RepID=UPI00365E2D71
MASAIRFIADLELAERITARRAESDELEERLVKQLAEYGPSETNSPWLNGSGIGRASSAPIPPAPPTSCAACWSWRTPK